MKAVIFVPWFEPTQELKDFCKSIGYKTHVYALDYDLMFDPRVVEFCENRLSPLWNENVYKGKESYKLRCGFAGAGYIRDIDTNKKWNISYNDFDAPIINYMKIHTNKYGKISFVQD